MPRAGARSADPSACQLNDLNLMMQLQQIKLDSLGLLFVGLFLELSGGLFIFLTNFIEFLHVLKELWTSLESDEKFGLLTVAAVVGGLHSDGLGSDLLEGGVVVSKHKNRLPL